MRHSLLRFFIILFPCLLGLINAQAATYDWVGTNSANWNATGNWKQGVIPTATDNVQIGVAYAVVQSPNINGLNITVKSILFGSNYPTSINIGINLKSSATLTVTNDITVQADANTAGQGTNAVYLTGTTGSITATNFNVISNYAASTSYTQVLYANVATVTLSGNIALTSSDNGTSSVTYNSTFVQTNGIISLTGKLSSTNTTNATSTFTVNPSSSAGATLQLANQYALSALSATGTNAVNFNNTYATIEYSGAAQTIYSDLAITGLSGGGPVYYSIKFSGTGIKNTNNGNYLTVYGDFTNAMANDASNYLTFTNVTVRFIGSVTQNLYGGPGNGTTFKKINCNLGAAKVMQSGTFYVESDGTLLMNGSSAGTTLTTNGLLTLLSDASSTATIGNNNIEPTIIGNVNVQRFVTGGTGYRGYRLFSSPVNINNVTAQTSTVGYIGLSYLNTTVNSVAGVLTAGPGGTASGFSVANTNPLIYLYDQSRTTNNHSYTSGKDIGVTAITGASGSPAYSVTTLGAATTTGVQIPVGNSYLVYYVGSTASTVIASTRTPDNATATAVGYANQGTIPVNFWNYTNTASTTMPYTTGTGSFLSGVNQMGNPYPATINLIKVYNDNSSYISPTFYELNAPGQNYISYNGLDSTKSDARASRYIVSGQGFLSVALGTGSTFTFYEDQKVGYPNMTTTTTTKAQGGTLLMAIWVPQPALADDSTPTTQQVALPVVQDAFIEKNNSALSGLHLQLSRDTLTYIQTGIYFGKNRSDKFNQKEDAYDLGGPSPQVYISSYSSDGVQLAINEMGDYLLGKRIKLFVKSVSDGMHIISLADVQNIDTNLFRIELVDNLLKDSVNLAKTKAYAFNITNADTTTYGSGRFVLAIRIRPLPLYKLLSFLGQKTTGGVQLNWKVSNAGYYTGFTLQKLQPNNTYSQLYSVQSDSSSTYTYVDAHPVIGNNVYRLAQSDAVGDITYSAPVTIGYNNNSPLGSLTVYPNPAINTINISLSTTTANLTNYSADIYDASGKLMKHETVSSTHWADDISAFKYGIYIIRVKDNKGNITGEAKFSKTN